MEAAEREEAAQCTVSSKARRAEMTEAVLDLEEAVVTADGAGIALLHEYTSDKDCLCCRLLMKFRA